jgi:hypothetical protein
MVEARILAYITSFFRSATTCALVATAVLGPFSVPSATCLPQTSSDIHRGDNSDWWSNRRTLESDNSIKTEEQDPPEKHLQISVVRLRDDMFTIATTHFGKTPLISRGDAATSRDQLCYFSKDKPKIHQGTTSVVPKAPVHSHLPFPQSEMNSSQKRLLGSRCFSSGNNWPIESWASAPEDTPARRPNYL